MKQTLLLTLLLLMVGFASAQIVTPVIKANFGVDADLKANFFNGAPDPGNDDWFNDGTPGSGVFVIDTTGAAAIMTQYALDSNARKKSFVRGMNYPMYSTINGKLLIDAVYVRDHYKMDSTAYVSSNKNGQSPGIWDGGTTPIPDKTDINDFMLHVRRDGPAMSDSLWLFAGLSLHGNTGNRYFDIELYQTDIYYDKASNKFANYGPEAGHTSWLFDASGNVTRPGDVIFTAEFGSSALTLLEARIWIDKSSLSITPTQFTWGGAFDGDGSSAQYGYASIVPKTAGIFYGGNQCAANTWAGPFGYVDVTNILSVNYDQRHFMEVAVNMTKIGLDPYTILGSSCNLSFKKVFAKTRSSTSFTADLKDFVGPYRLVPPAIATADLEVYCGTGAGSFELSVHNPVSTSTYAWTTTDGHIISSPATGTTISADQPGTYIVSQTLHSGCTPYVSDTITIVNNSQRCTILASENFRFSGTNNYPLIELNWVSSGKDISRFEVQRSVDGRSFQTIAVVDAELNAAADHAYELTDKVSQLDNKIIYYRLKSSKANQQFSYSNIISIKNAKISNDGFVITPNPASEHLQVLFKQPSRAKTFVNIYNSTGNEVQKTVLKTDGEKINIAKLPPGMYFVVAHSEGSVIAKKKLLVTR
jgi:hypothetical protein